MMNIHAGRERTKLSYKILSAFIAFTFSFTSVVPPSYAQSLASLNLPVPGAMISPSAAFVPVLLKGMTIYPDNPLQFDFIVDSGNTGLDVGAGPNAGVQNFEPLRKESEKLVKYFLASMTIPKDDLWVNLSPYEKGRIIPDELGKTELGRDMLAQDYILKQLTASLMYPEKELGKEFWDKIYKKAQEKYGTTEIPVDTFNKVWILPETATVYEHGQTVYIVEAKLKVMLDSDYLTMSHNVTTSQSHKDGTGDVVTGDLVTPQIVREVILPAIEKEVNEGQNFAPLRQIYHSLILAKWYKETVKNSLLSKIYVDQKKIAGVNIDDATLKDQIYAQYMEAYKKGVFNYIKEDYDRLSNETIPRKYFSGGEQLTQIPLTKTNNPVVGNGLEGKGHRVTVINTPQKDGVSSPIEIPFTTRWYINRLNSDNPEVREKAIQKLRERIDTLFGWLRSDYSGNRLLAAEALGNLGDKRAVEPLLKYLVSYQNKYVLSAVVKALSNLADQRAVGPLKELLFSTPATIETQVDVIGGDGTWWGIRGEDIANPLYYQIIDALKKLGASSAIRKKGTALDSPDQSSPSDTSQSSSPITPQEARAMIKGTEITKYEGRTTKDEEVGGIDMNTIDLDRQGGGVDIQFDPADLQEIIDAGIDGFAPVIINITPLPSVLPLLGLEPANKEEPLEVSVLSGD